MTTPKQNLIVARQLLIDVGWCQRNYQRVDGNKTIAYCSAGALMEATRNCLIEIDPSNGYAGAATYLRQAIGCPEDMPISGWNDHQGRTKEEIIAVFDEAIKLAS